MANVPLSSLNKLTLIRPVTAVLFLLLQSHFSTLSCQGILSDSLMKERIDVIEQMLSQDKRAANCWWKGWLAGYSAATLVQSAIAITSDNLKGRQDWSLGALSTLFGAAGQLIAPMPEGFKSDPLKDMPGETSDQLLIKLIKAEQLLQDCAQREKNGRSWKTHVLDGAVNLGFGAVVWLGLKRSFTEGAGNFALNTAICEAQIFSQPVRAVKDYNRYVKNHKPGESTFSPTDQVTWYFTMRPGGIGVKIVF